MTGQPVRTAAMRALRDHLPAGATLVLGLSGGRDSVALLDALVAVAGERGHALVAAHVHHGLSAHADAWARFCAELCAQRGITFREQRVVVARAPRQSLEAEARRQRYAALAAIARDVNAPMVALAHHRDDQAETVLLQLLRGAGPHGLAAMPVIRPGPLGIDWLRPLLGVSRGEIDDYVAQQGLRWVDDDSNADDAHLRNAMRQRVLPPLAALVPAFGATLRRAATHQAEAALLIDELAELDAAAAGDGATLDRAALAALPPHRARNLLRWFLRFHDLPAPSTARLDAMLDQLVRARADAAIRLAHAGVEVGVHRGRIAVHAPPPPAFEVAWVGEPELALPHGTVRFTPTTGSGVDAARLAAAPVSVRSRAGGERLQLAANRPRRALKSVLHDAAVPPWQRAALPLVYSGDALAAVAGFAVDAQFAASAGAPGIAISWHPSAR